MEDGVDLVPGGGGEGGDGRLAGGDGGEEQQAAGERGEGVTGHAGEAVRGCILVRYTTRGHKRGTVVRLWRIGVW